MFFLVPLAMAVQLTKVQVCPAHYRDIPSAESLIASGQTLPCGYTPPACFPSALVLTHNQPVECILAPLLFFREPQLHL